MISRAEEMLQGIKEVIEALAAESDGLLLAAQKISKRYRDINPHGTRDFRAVSTQNEALAYAAARMPATFGAVYSSLSHAAEIHPIEPKSLLDIGAGPGTAAWVACALFPSIQSITFVEREQAMQEMGKKIIDQHPDTPRTLKEAIWECTDIRKLSPTKADLVIASYSVGELTEDERILLCKHLLASSEMMLLLVEPGTPDSYRKLMSVRTHLLAGNAHLAAPCPHNDDCPLPPEDWCHFTCRIQRNRLQKHLKGGSAPFEDEKFSYLAFAPDAKNISPTSRVLRKPIIHPGKINLKLCTDMGIHEISVGKHSKSAFRNARKAAHGDLFLENNDS